MQTKITSGARAELVRALRERYQTTSRAEKARILAEFCAVSGYHNKHAIRVLNAAEDPIEPSSRRGRPRLYDEAVRQALIVLWEASDRICGKRLKPLFGVLIPALERHRHIKLDPAVRAKLLNIGTATIDRLLKTTRLVATPGDATALSDPSPTEGTGAYICRLEGTRSGKHGNGSGGALWRKQQRQLRPLSRIDRRS